MEFEKDIIGCLEVLRRGGIILYPTDTVWGLGCDATNPEAVSKLYSLKQRTASKSMIVLLADRRDLKHYTGRPEPYIETYLEQTTQPITVVYEQALGLADNLIAEDGTIAIRIVDEVFCRDLIKRFRKPLVSTSANISGEETPVYFRDISDEVVQGVDYVVKYRQDDSRPSRSSMLIRFSKEGDVVVLRP